MEADFQREYNIDLSQPEALVRMSWRRFIVLVRGLGPNSATAVKLRVRLHGAQGPRSRGKFDTTGVPVITGKQNVARYFGVRLPAQEPD